MFKIFFKYDNPSELKNALMDADEKEYSELKNNIKTTQHFLMNKLRLKLVLNAQNLKTQ